jgi:hypothetical protein
MRPETDHLIKLIMGAVCFLVVGIPVLLVLKETIFGSSKRGSHSSWNDHGLVGLIGCPMCNGICKGPGRCCHCKDCRFWFGGSTGHTQNSDGTFSY